MLPNNDLSLSTNLIMLLNTKLTHRNLSHSYTLTTKDKEENQGNNPIHHHIKKYKIPRNKPTYHFMGNRWETVEKGADFIFLGSKITACGDCSHEIKTLTPCKKVMSNLDSIFKSRDITLPTKVRLVKAMVFSSSHVWM